MAGQSSEAQDLHFACAKCGQNLVVDSSGAGLSVECPGCGNSLIVPNQCENALALNEIRCFDTKELSEIARRTAERLTLEFDKDAIEIISRSSTGTATDILQKILHVRDHARRNGCYGKISGDLTATALKFKPTGSPQKQSERMIADVLNSSSRQPLETFAHFIGQEKITERLQIAISAAQLRGDPLGHVLLIGSPRSGKSTLAKCIASALGTGFHSITAQGMTKPGDLAGVLTNLDERDVLFIEDIDRSRQFVKEYLELAMTSFLLQIVIDQSPDARCVPLNLPKFTVIGTTSDKTLVDESFLACFPIVEKLSPYKPVDLIRIAKHFSEKLNVDLDDKASETIALSTDGTPVDVFNKLKHVRDYAQVKAGAGKISHDTAVAALKLITITQIRQESPQKAGHERQAIPAPVRREVWRRDQGRCVKCGSRERLEYDHIIPVTKGGSNTARNIELLCEICNRAKSNLIG